jgi:hypothetical protein
MKVLDMLPPTLDPSSLAHFAIDYASARRRFMAGLEGLSIAAHDRSLTYAGQGPQGESLHTDVAWLGAPDAARVLCLISGTHGVEAFAGSAIQCDLLARLSAGARLPKDTACLLVHVLNPWGFAWLRRCNEDGIDLNRNFIDFSAIPPVNPGYDNLASAIVPGDGDWEGANARLAEAARVLSRRDYETAVSAGQYHHPKGLFYGGQRAAAARCLLEDLIDENDLGARQLAVIDVHSGLGPFGYGEIICDHPSTSAGLSTARQWYGDAVTSPDEGTSSSVPKHGLLDYLWHDVMSNDSCFVTLEFGTYCTDRMFDVLRKDHALHAHGVPQWNADSTRSVKQAMRKQFFPDTPAWNALVIFQGRQIIDQALAGLTGRELLAP